MSRNFVSTAAVALAAAALLVACDKTKAPSPTAAAEDVRAAAAAAAAPPAATAQIEEAATAPVEEVRVPHVAKDGEPGLDSLKPLQGKYRWDGVDYVKDGVLAQRLKTLMGPQYDTLLKNLQALGPLEPSAALLYVMGNRQHQGGEEMAAVVIDPVRNGLRVWLLSEGRQTVFTDVDGADIPWPSAVQSMLRNIVATQ
ncbi:MULTISPECIES: hypothetical protein [Comamonas]|uniref:Lipoprotein n=1 Tax=Comamonas testosteroni TaxID=285 RepID=A0A8B4S5I9_COMTE|nr:MULTISPECIES: hypothetical protein [Comamonas]EHN64778.1 hypothetical protein CTATCC11996_15145 [Comamonas testosteroni ATCC 11996]QQN68030.1 hypothetical protein IYN88_14525 [Comamonas testosteroni]RDI09610.1 hypothetical protein DFO48_107120 [Comamonas sp. AG1104]SUY78749.1 Uncharacterised protein [Comamonas testosteroni]